MMFWVPVEIPALKRPFAIMISRVLVKVPVKVSALKRPFAIMISWVPAKIQALKRPFAIMIGCDLLAPVHRFWR